MFWPVLPAMSMLPVLCILTALCLYFCSRNWITGLVIGILWASSVGHWYSSWQLPYRFFNKNIMIEGVVDSLHIEQNQGEQINYLEDTYVYPTPVAKIKKSQEKPSANKVYIIKIKRLGVTSLTQPVLVRVSWFAPTIRLRQGNQVQLLVTLAPPHSVLNSGDFVLQKWLASKNIVALGKVRASPSNQIVDASITWRQSLVDQVQSIGLEHSRWIMSLAFGARQGLTAKDWELLQVSGTAHLFAISGMHLAIVTGLFVVIFKAITFLFYCLRASLSGKSSGKSSGKNRCAFLFQSNVIRICLVLSLPCCALYAVLSGLQVPVLRAFLGLMCYLYLVYFSLYWRFTSVLLFLLCTLLIMFPLSILSLSFWFSFSAVLLIVFFIWRFTQKGMSLKQKVLNLIYLQVFLSVFMLPATAASFATISIISPVINLLLLPLFSFVLVPLSLLSIILLLLSLDSAATSILFVLDGLFDLLLSLLTFATSLPMSGFRGLAYPGLFWCLVIVLLLFIALPFWPQRKFIVSSLIVCMFLSIFEWPVPKHRWKMTLVDVGQGLSVLIESEGEVLIYDTGRVFPDDILPMGGRRGDFSFDVDTLVNSHYDNDHAGGNGFLFSTYNVKNAFGPDYGCYQSTDKNEEPWLKGVKIDVLWPLHAVSGENNNESCVLKISKGEFSVLLTGDIEAEVERKLVALYKNTGELKSTILVSPHHGSKTSSSLAFVKHVQADYALVSSKFMNQWGFPHAYVLSNYASIGTKVLNTAYDGSIGIEIGQQGYHIHTMRGDFLSPWYMNIRRR
jgi:competence protein ComEC